METDTGSRDECSNACAAGNDIRSRSDREYRSTK